MTTVAERLRRARRAGMVGRDRELARLREAAAEGRSLVVFVQGAGGTGKTLLLRCLADELAEAGREVDFRRIEPDTGGFATSAGSDGTGHSGTSHSGTGPEARGPVVLIVDDVTPEDGPRLRERVLPGLRSGSLIVLAGRGAPDLGWHADPAWDGAFEHLRLGDLPADAAADLLAARGIPAERRESIIADRGANPLVLTLAAEKPTTPEMLSALSDLLVGDVPGPEHRTALEVCAHAMVTTEDLLRAVVGDRAPDLFAWLRRQPSVEVTPLGLRPHDAARLAVDADLRWRDPSRYRMLHDRLVEHALARVESAAGDAVEPALRAMHHLLNTVEGRITYPDMGEVGEVRAVPLAREDLARFAPSAERELAEFWFDRQPESFEAYHLGSACPVGYMGLLRSQAPDPVECERDPIVAAAWRHAASAPLRPGESLVVARFVHPWVPGMPAVAGFYNLLRMLGVWLRGPRVTWSFLIVPDGSPLHLMTNLADHHVIGAPVTVGGRGHTIFAHDWRAAPRAEWVRSQSRHALLGDDVRPAPAPPVMAALTRDDFDVAVRDALRHWHRPDRLAGNPLLRSRVPGPDGGLDGLRRALAEAVDALRLDPRERKLHRVLATTYLRPAASREAAAEELGLPFSTYRRHLNRGVERVSAYLWELDQI